MYLYSHVLRSTKVEFFILSVKLSLDFTVFLSQPGPLLGSSWEPRRKQIYECIGLNPKALDPKPTLNP